MTVNVGSKQRFFLLLVTKDRINPTVGAKNAGCWSCYAGGSLIQCTFNGRLSMHEKAVTKSRWSLNAGFTVRPNVRSVIVWAPKDKKQSFSGCREAKTLDLVQVESLILRRKRTLHFTPFSATIEAGWSCAVGRRTQLRVDPLRMDDLLNFKRWSWSHFFLFDFQKKNLRLEENKTLPTIPCFCLYAQEITPQHLF